MAGAILSDIKAGVLAMAAAVGSIIVASFILGLFNFIGYEITNNTTQVATVYGPISKQWGTIVTIGFIGAALLIIFPAIRYLYERFGPGGGGGGK